MRVCLFILTVYCSSVGLVAASGHFPFSLPNFRNPFLSSTTRSSTTSSSTTSSSTTSRVSRTIPNLDPRDRLTLWRIKAASIKIFHLADDSQISTPELSVTDTPDEQQIDEDIPRSLTSPRLRNDLRDVLMAYAANPASEGYVQGQNFIAGPLLRLGLTTEEVFYLLLYFAKDVAVDYFSSDMQGVARDALEISGRFDKCKEEAEILSLNLLPSMTSGTIDKEKVLRLWDAILFLGRDGWLAVVTALIALACEKTTEITAMQAALPTLDIEAVLRKAVTLLHTN